MRRVWSVLAGCVVAVGVVLGTPATASADVSITPTQARQGDEADLTFRVTEDRPGAHTTKVEVRLPDAAPVAEVYPLSDPHWAAKITYRELTHSVQGHHGSGSTTVASGITWFRAADAASDKPAELRVAMGPMPQVDRLTLTVLQTYSDGLVRRWPSASGAQGGAGPVLVLTPAAAQPDAAAQTRGPSAGPSAAAQPDAAAQASPAGSSAGADGSGPEGNASLGLTLGFGLTLGLLAGLVLVLRRVRGRRPTPEDEGPLESPDEDTPQPADLEPTRPSI
jgi:uncharacterized protein YcnI